MVIEYDKKFDECIFDLTIIALDVLAQFKIPLTQVDGRGMFREIFEIASDFLYVDGTTARQFASDEQYLAEIGEYGRSRILSSILGGDKNEQS